MKIKVRHILFRWMNVGVLVCCSALQVAGQFTSLNADRKIDTQYNYPDGTRDAIFVFNQTNTGQLSLQQPELTTFKWYRVSGNNFEPTPFYEVTGFETSRDDLEEGGYKVTMTTSGETVPSDSVTAWLYMNPGFEFRLHKDANDEVTWYNKFCFHTDFRLDSRIEIDEFVYFYPVNLARQVLINRITFVMKPENDAEVVRPLNTQGDRQFLRDNNPPYKDTQFQFRAFDMFGIEKEDRIMYRTIIPYATNVKAHLPEIDPTSAPVPVKFTYESYNASDYVWRFGDGDSVIFNVSVSDKLPPDTVRHTFYTPRAQAYQVELKVISEWDCSYTSEPVRITVAPPSLEVANVFTPNNDGRNDYFKPSTISLRRFEIWIYTRAGRRVFYHRGDDLRNWEGWDGRIENTGREAAEGVYFYIIKAAGWDEPPTRSPQSGPYSGSFHLYR